MESIVFGPIRWCVWSFRPSSPLRLPHLKCLFVCLFVCCICVTNFLTLCALVVGFCACNGSSTFLKAAAAASIPEKDSNSSTAAKGQCRGELQPESSFLQMKQVNILIHLGATQFGVTSKSRGTTSMQKDATDAGLATGYKVKHSRTNRKLPSANRGYP